MNQIRLGLVAIALLLAACFAESGFEDVVREATRTLDAVIEQIGAGPIREAAERGRDTVDEARAAIEAFRENPNAETRQALEDAERNLDNARDGLSGLLEGAPGAIRDTLGRVVDALERIRREIRQDLED